MHNTYFHNISQYIQKRTIPISIFGIFLIISFFFIHLPIIFYTSIALFSIIIILLKLILYNIVRMNDRSITNFILILIVLYTFVIIIFGLMFYYFSDNNHYLHYMDGKKVKYLQEYIYFSAITYFSVGYGDIVPMGIFRFIAIIEIILMNIMHIVFIGTIANFIIGNRLQHELKVVTVVEKELEKNIKKEIEIEKKIEKELKDIKE